MAREVSYATFGAEGKKKCAIRLGMKKHFHRNVRRKLFREKLGRSFSSKFLDFFFGKHMEIDKKENRKCHCL